MLKEVIHYTDYDGNERTRTAYFNISKPELLELEASEKGGFDKMLNDVIDAQDVGTLLAIFKRILHLSYGVKSNDGDRFIKNEEVWNEFAQSLAYEELYMKLATDADFAQHFMKGIIPNIDDVLAKVNANRAGNLQQV